MRLYFTGSDVQLLNEFPPQLRKSKYLYVWLYRQVVRFSKFCVEGYAVGHNHLIPELRKFGLKKEIIEHPSPIIYSNKFPKKEHKGFNVFYYCPLGPDREWNKWIYGFDVFQEVKKHYGKEINFIWSWGQFDMVETFPYIDFYLRCNRHDGDARLVRECQIQEIPYYWSWENPSVEEIIKKIDNVRNN